MVKAERIYLRSDNFVRAVITGVNFMLKSIFGIAVAATAIILPDFAHAGSGSDTAAASFTVLKQCNLLVTDLELGTFSVDQTWDSIGGLHGKYDGASYTAGTGELIKFGVINCDLGTLYDRPPLSGPH